MNTIRSDSHDESTSKFVRMAASVEPELTATHWRFPLVHRGRILGRLTIAVPPGNEEAVCPTLVQDLVNEFSRLLDQARRFELAHEEALKDELTGLGNRRMFERSLRSYIESARDQGFPFSVLLFDVDHFKKFNDNWGHEAGDRVLRLIADLMKRVFRTDDVVCRIGGEEFAVLLCDQRAHGRESTPPREARAFGERLQREAERLFEGAERRRPAWRRFRSAAAWRRSRGTPNRPKNFFAKPTTRSTPPNAPAATASTSPATTPTSSPPWRGELQLSWSPAFSRNRRPLKPAEAETRTSNHPTSRHPRGINPIRSCSFCFGELAISCRVSEIP